LQKLQAHQESHWTPMQARLEAYWHPQAVGQTPMLELVLLLALMLVLRLMLMPVHVYEEVL